MKIFSHKFMFSLYKSVLAGVVCSIVCTIYFLIEIEKFNRNNMDFVVQFVICYYLMLGYGVYLAFKGFKREDWYLKPDDRFVLKNEQGSNSVIYRFVFAQSYKEIRFKNTQDNSDFIISHDQLLKDYKPLV